MAFLAQPTRTRRTNRTVRTIAATLVHCLILTAIFLTSGRLTYAQTYNTWALACTGVTYASSATSDKSISISYTNPSAYTTCTGTTPPAQGQPTSYYLGSMYMTLNRVPSGSGFPAAVTGGPGTTETYVDHDISPNTHYEYYLTGTSSSCVWNAQTGHWEPISNPVRGSSFYVTVRKVFASATQSVDSRYDLRFSTFTSKNYNFKNNIYRGGLFAGYNADSGRVGRAYLKFPAVTGPDTAAPNEKIWNVGGLYIMCPRLAKNGTVNLSLRPTSATWDINTLVWDTAPAPRTAGGGGGSITWTAATPQQPSPVFTGTVDMVLSRLPPNADPNTLASKIESNSGWVKLDALSDIQENAGSGQPMSLCLMSSLETSSGWAYFNKNGYPDGTADCYLLYAFGGNGVGVASLSFNATTLAGGGTTTGSVVLTTPAPSGGAVVGLTYSDPALTGPATVSIAAGQSSGNFTVTAGTPMNLTNVTVTALFGGTKTATVTVSGGGGGGGSSVTLTSLTVPSGLTSGTTGTGTVTLASAAPMGGALVTLSSNNTTYLTVPASITVPAGQTSATFTLTAKTIASGSVTVTVTATSANSKTGTVTVHP